MLKSICTFQLNFIILVLVISNTYSQNYENLSDIRSLDKNYKEMLAKAISFEELFTKINEIKLDVGNMPIGEITQMDVSHNHNFLILDNTGPELSLFNKNGKLIKNLNAQIHDTIPGLKWEPQLAKFSEDGLILVRGRGSHNLFLFDSLGNYVEKVPAKFPFQYQDFVMNAKGNIYGYSILQPNEFWIKMLNQKGEVLKKGGIFPSKFKNFFSRMSRIGNLLLLDRNNNIYQANQCGPEIYKFSEDLDHLKTFFRNPPFYRRIKEDLPDVQGNPEEFISKATKLLNNSTRTASIFLLNEKLILVEYIDFGKNGGIYLDICSLEGEYYTQRKITFFHILAAKDNFIYRSYQPEVDKQGNLPNPVVIVYKFKLK